MVDVARHAQSLLNGLRTCATCPRYRFIIRIIVCLVRIEVSEMRLGLRCPWGVTMYPPKAEYGSVGSGSVKGTERGSRTLRVFMMLVFVKLSQPSFIVAVSFRRCFGSITVPEAGSRSPSRYRLKSSFFYPHLSPCSVPGPLAVPRPSLRPIGFDYTHILYAIVYKPAGEAAAVAGGSCGRRVWKVTEKQSKAERKQRRRPGGRNLEGRQKMGHSAQW
ncbi:hypothetical protein HOY80DRAFT_619474 [Tuber brumale]|nr:hypothetical protein HOY80DRAFT_619474 [Tuber brumale]